MTLVEDLLAPEPSVAHTVARSIIEAGENLAYPVDADAPEIVDDIERLDELSRADPDANFGIVCSSTFAALEVVGEDGWQTLAGLGDMLGGLTISAGERSYVYLGTQEIRLPAGMT